MNQMTLWNRYYIYVLYLNGQLKHTHYLIIIIGVLFLIKGIPPPPVVMYNKNGVLDLLHSSKRLQDRLSSCISCTCTTLRLRNHTPTLYYLVHYTMLLYFSECCLKTLLGRLSFLRGVHNVLKWVIHFVDTRV